MIWFVFALLTGVAVAVLLWPLTGPPRETREDAADVAFYRAQIAEIDAEFSRGGVASDEAEAARLAGRRLLAAAREETARRRAAREKTRNFPDRARRASDHAGPLRQGRTAQSARHADRVATARRRRRRKHEIARPTGGRLAAHPRDGKALEQITPLYLAAGRYDDAVRTSKAAIDVLGELPERLVKYAEALSYANDGEFSPQAVTQLERASKLAPKYLLARYYLGLAAAQQGEVEKGEEIWTAMLPELSPGLEGEKRCSRKTRAA